LVARNLDREMPRAPTSLEEVLAVDAEARQRAQTMLEPA
jgi:1-deoxy-D-xylulose-5-phosphate reductoisomerase